MFKTWSRERKLWAGGALLFALGSLLMAGPVARIFDGVADSVGRPNFDRVFSACEFIVAGVLVIWLGRRMQALGSLVGLKLLAWALWGLAVFLAESRNLLQVEHVHYFQYGLLGLILWRVLRGRIVWVVLLGAGVGLLDEIVQGQVKGRFFDWADAMFNLLGVVGGALIAWSASATRERPSGFAKLAQVALLVPLVMLGSTRTAAAGGVKVNWRGWPDPTMALEALKISPESLGRPADTGSLPGMSPVAIDYLAKPFFYLRYEYTLDRERLEYSNQKQIDVVGQRHPYATPLVTSERFLKSKVLTEALGKDLAAAVQEAVTEAVSCRRMFQFWLAEVTSVDERAALEQALLAAYLPRREGTAMPDLAIVRRIAQVKRLGLALQGERLAIAAKRLEQAAIVGASVPGPVLGNTNACARGDVRFFERTLWGPVVVGGPGETEFDCEDPLLVLDLGGDDTYNISARPLPAWQRMQVSVLVDASGNDSYQASGRGQLGGAFFGYSILIDSTGDDMYVADEIALGAGVVGYGHLIDRAGSDTYRARALAQGAGVIGDGALSDDAGADRYDLGMFGQGSGGVGGNGALIDRSGDDLYSIGGLIPDFREPNKGSISYGQGYGFGHRELGLAGGRGTLADLDGHDTYQASYFGQGVGSFYGSGVLFDGGGNDRYLSHRYSQGAGVHMGAGYLIDRSGDDLYDAFGVAQGIGHDQAVGVLVDGSGNDRYDLGFLGQGGARAGGMGLLLDGGGADRYWAGGKNTQGAAETGEDPQRNSMGLLIDLGGQDFYTGQGKNNTIWRDAGKSAGIDMEEDQPAAP